MWFRVIDDLYFYFCDFCIRKVCVWGYFFEKLNYRIIKEIVLY